MVNYAILKLSCLKCKRLYGCNYLAPDNLAAEHFFQIKSFSAFAENMYFNENIRVRPFCPSSLLVVIFCASFIVFTAYLCHSY